MKRHRMHDPASEKDVQAKVYLVLACLACVPVWFYSIYSLALGVLLFALYCTEKNRIVHRLAGGSLAALDVITGVLLCLPQRAGSFGASGASLDGHLLFATIVFLLALLLAVFVLLAFKAKNENSLQAPACIFADSLKDDSIMQFSVMPYTPAYEATEDEDGQDYPLFGSFLDDAEDEEGEGTPYPPPGSNRYSLTDFIDFLEGPDFPRVPLLDEIINADFSTLEDELEDYREAAEQIAASVRYETGLPTEPPEAPGTQIVPSEAQGYGDDSIQMSRKALEGGESAEPFPSPAMTESSGIAGYATSYNPLSQNLAGPTAIPAGACSPAVPVMQVTRNEDVAPLAGPPAEHSPKSTPEPVIPPVAYELGPEVYMSYTEQYKYRAAHTPQAKLKPLEAVAPPVPLEDPPMAQPDNSATPAHQEQEKKAFLSLWALPEPPAPDPNDELQKEKESYRRPNWL